MTLWQRLAGLFRRRREIVFRRLSDGRVERIRID
jgi:hypothetical protein